MADAEEGDTGVELTEEQPENEEPVQPEEEQIETKEEPPETEEQASEIKEEPIEAEEQPPEINEEPIEEEQQETKEETPEDAEEQESEIKQEPSPEPEAENQEPESQQEEPTEPEEETAPVAETEDVQEEEPATVTGNDVADTEDEITDAVMEEKKEMIVMDTEEEILEDENKILYEEERERTLAAAAAVEDADRDEMEPPETKEVIEVGEPQSEYEEEVGESRDDAQEGATEEIGETEAEETGPQVTEEQDAEESEPLDESVSHDQEPNSVGGIGEAKEFLQEAQEEGELLAPEGKPGAVKEQATKKGTPPITDAGAAKRKKKTFPYRARDIETNHIQEALKRTPPKHDHFGFIFSADTRRPPAYYHNYFLPFQGQPKAKQHIKILGKIIPYDAVKPFITAPTHSMPLSTIKVRWLLGRRNTVYKPEDIYTYLSRFGKIERVYQVTSNSALVEFTSLEAANRVVRTAGLGYPWDPLIADWADKRMNNQGYFKKYANIEEAPYTAEIGF